MVGTQRLLAIAMVFSLSSSPSGKPDALGIVVQAEHASLGSEDAAEGTTIYDGDRLTTGAKGSLRLLIGEGMLTLGEQSSVTVHGYSSGAPKEFEVELVSGTVGLSLTADTAAEIVVGSARISPLSQTKGAAQVQRVGPFELIVFAQRGPAQITYHGESETIAEGKSYRVLLNASEDGVGGGQATQKPGRRSKALLLILSGSAAGVIALSGENRGKHKGMESPDRP